MRETAALVDWATLNVIALASARPGGSVPLRVDQIVPTAAAAGRAVVGGMIFGTVVLGLIFLLRFLAGLVGLFVVG
jgi:hypothetical protein